MLDGGSLSGGVGSGAAVKTDLANKFFECLHL